MCYDYKYGQCITDDFGTEVTNKFHFSKVENTFLLG